MEYHETSKLGQRMIKTHQIVTEISAAFADLGTFLPLVLGLVVIAGVDPVGLLFGFGLFALMSAWVYQRPVPVQPMKAVAAMAIAGLISADTLIATGLLIGVFLIAISQTGVIGFLKRCIPNTVLYGMRLALGVSLILTTLSFGSIEYGPTLILLLALIGLQLTALRGVSCLLLLVGGFVWLGILPESSTWAPEWALPSWSIPAWAAIQASMTDALLPQIALTLTNALILTAVIAKEYFPDDPRVHTESRYALTSGIANVVLAPLGAIPMCHGAGGLAAHYAMGARTGVSIAFFGIVCLGAAVVFGPQITAFFVAMPMEVVTPLVVYAAWVLADPPTLLRLRPTCLLIIVAMVPVALLFGLMPALLAGVLAEHVRLAIMDRRAV